MADAEKIKIDINNAVPYERFITGQNGIPHINEKDDVVVLKFIMPDAKVARIQWAEHMADPRFRWIEITGPAHPFPVNKQQTGTLNFVKGEPQAGTNEMHTPPGTEVKVKVYQYDPATVPTHGDSWNDLRDMVFDWSRT